MTLEKALDAYRNHFGEDYPLVITGTTSEDEIIDEIERCIETNEKAEEPEYDDNEEGTVIAKVNYKTKEVEYLDNDARTDAYAQEIINETLKQIDDGDFENCD